MLRHVCESEVETTLCRRQPSCHLTRIPAPQQHVYSMTARTLHGAFVCFRPTSRCTLPCTQATGHCARPRFDAHSRLVPTASILTHAWCPLPQYSLTLGAHCFSTDSRLVPTASMPTHAWCPLLRCSLTLGAHCFNNDYSCMVPTASRRFLGQPRGCPPRCRPCQGHRCWGRQEGRWWWRWRYW
jgi:hypothetical protein